MNVFVTVGSMLPFDRLVKAADDWAGAHPGHEVFAQVGHGGLSPRHMASQEMLAPDQFAERCRAADVIVSHVGMGTILAASEFRRPLVCLARRPELREVTSQHQTASARWLGQRPGIRILDDESQLAQALAAFDRLDQAVSLTTTVSPSLLEAVSRFLDDAERRR